MDGGKLGYYYCVAQHGECVLLLDHLTTFNIGQIIGRQQENKNLVTHLLEAAG